MVGERSWRPIDADQRDVEKRVRHGGLRHWNKGLGPQQAFMNLWRRPPRASCSRTRRNYRSNRPPQVAGRGRSLLNCPGLARPRTRPIFAAAQATVRGALQEEDQTMPDVTERLREGAHAILEKAGELHERIRRRAHAIWEREGWPHGRDQDHWHAAQIRAFGRSRRGSRRGARPQSQRESPAPPSRPPPRPRPKPPRRSRAALPPKKQQ